MKVLFAQGKGTVVGYVSVAHIIFAIVCQEDGTFINLPLDKIRKDMSDEQRSKWKKIPNTRKGKGSWQCYKKNNVP